MEEEKLEESPYYYWKPNLCALRNESLSRSALMWGLGVERESECIGGALSNGPLALPPHH